MQPVEQFITRHPIQLVPEVEREITRIQRVLSDHASDDAMNALLSRGRLRLCRGALRPR